MRDHQEDGLQDHPCRPAGSAGGIRTSRRFRSASSICPWLRPRRSAIAVAEILEEIGLERVGAPGTTAALAMLNDQVKKGGVMASSYVGGLSGAFIPVSEDQGMIDAVNAGRSYDRETGSHDLCLLRRS
ncbi:MAG: DUF711 family protein [Clostridium fessum]